MPGTIILKPIEAKLDTEEGKLTKVDPYCVAVVGDRRVESEVCKKGGPNPIWNDALEITCGNEPVCYLEVKDKNFLKDKMLGTCTIDLGELQLEKSSKRWYELYCNEKPAGEILVETLYSPEGDSERHVIYPPEAYFSRSMRFNKRTLEDYIASATVLEKDKSGNIRAEEVKVLNETPRFMQESHETKPSFSDKMLDVKEKVINKVEHVKEITFEKVIPLRRDKEPELIKTENESDLITEERPPFKERMHDLKEKALDKLEHLKDVAQQKISHLRKDEEQEIMKTEEKTTLVSEEERLPKRSLSMKVDHLMEKVANQMAHLKVVSKGVYDLRQKVERRKGASQKKIDYEIINKYLNPKELQEKNIFISEEHQLPKHTLSEKAHDLKEKALDKIEHLKEVSKEKLSHLRKEEIREPKGPSTNKYALLPQDEQEIPKPTFSEKVHDMKEKLLTKVDYLKEVSKEKLLYFMKDEDYANSFTPAYIDLIRAEQEKEVQQPLLEKSPNITEELKELRKDPETLGYLGEKFNEGKTYGDFSYLQVPNFLNQKEIPYQNSANLEQMREQNQPSFNYFNPFPAAETRSFIQSNPTPLSNLPTMSERPLDEPLKRTNLGPDISAVTVSVFSELPPQSRNFLDDSCPLQNENRDFGSNFRQRIDENRNINEENEENIDPNRNLFTRDDQQTSSNQFNPPTKWFSRKVPY